MRHVLALMIFTTTACTAEAEEDWAATDEANQMAESAEPPREPPSVAPELESLHEIPHDPTSPLIAFVGTRRGLEAFTVRTSARSSLRGALSTRARLPAHTHVVRGEIRSSDISTIYIVDIDSHYCGGQEMDAVEVHSDEPLPSDDGNRYWLAFSIASGHPRVIHGLQDALLVKDSQIYLTENTRLESARIEEICP